MGQRGVLQPGATAPGLERALLAGVPATACVGSGPHPGGRRRAGAAPSRSAAVAAPAANGVVLCATTVGQWARGVLGGGACGGHQSTGLPDGRCGIAPRVALAAENLKRRHSAAAAALLSDRQARAARAGRYRDGTPSGSPRR